MVSGTCRFIRGRCAFASFLLRRSFSYNRSLRMRFGLALSSQTP